MNLRELVAELESQGKPKASEMPVLIVFNFRELLDEIEEAGGHVPETVGLAVESVTVEENILPGIHVAQILAK